MIDKCSVCCSDTLEPVLDLGSHPLCDDLLPIGSSHDCREFPIKIGFCNDCKTAHNLFHVENEMLFPKTYHYRSRFTKDVLSGMEDLVRGLGSYALRGGLILDVGCNDGSLLKLVRDIYPGIQVLGVEPTDAALDAEASDIPVIQDYFEPKIANQIVSEFGHPAVIIFTNVFAHINDFDSLIEGLKILMNKNTVIVVENHYLGSVLDRFQFDTFYHEHPRTYSASSFYEVANRLGGYVYDIQRTVRYGGNIRVVIGRDSNKEARDLSLVEKEKDFRCQFDDLSGRVLPTWIDTKRAEIENLNAQYGPLIGRSFPGRAAILVKLLGLNASHLLATYEKSGSMKIGHRIPGTSIPILDELDCDFENIKLMINLAWHINGEISDYLRGKGFQGSLIDIFDPSMF